MKSKIDIKEYLFITLGIMVVAGAVYFFMIPCQLVVGSLSGLVLVLSNFIPLFLAQTWLYRKRI